MYYIYIYKCIYVWVDSEYGRRKDDSRGRAMGKGTANGSESERRIRIADTYSPLAEKKQGASRGCNVSV